AHQPRAQFDQMIEQRRLRIVDVVNFEDHLSGSDQGLEAAPPNGSCGSFAAAWPGSPAPAASPPSGGLARASAAEDLPEASSSAAGGSAGKVSGGAWPPPFMVAVTSSFGCSSMTRLFCACHFFSISAISA